MKIGPCELGSPTEGEIFQIIIHPRGEKKMGISVEMRGRTPCKLLAKGLLNCPALPSAQSSQPAGLLTGLLPRALHSSLLAFRSSSTFVIKQAELLTSLAFLGILSMVQCCPLPKPHSPFPKLLTPEQPIAHFSHSPTPQGCRFLIPKQSLLAGHTSKQWACVPSVWLYRGER